jgi:hypothetical protein
MELAVLYYINCIVYNKHTFTNVQRLHVSILFFKESNIVLDTSTITYVKTKINMYRQFLCNKSWYQNTQNNFIKIFNIKSKY